ncbi:hypothetical protein ACLM45_00945 [Synechococcus sp. A10-1-5-9]|uniref:hypothetical protein n=1 Tax=Synechococcus sp. A10-1-5-9 TaxID=3392295 RepID=UPI0003267BB6
MFIEIGGADDSRHSTAAQSRSRLTFQATAPQVFAPSMGLPSIRRHLLEPWPQQLERPDTSPYAGNGLRHDP